MSHVNRLGSVLSLVLLASAGCHHRSETTPPDDGRSSATAGSDEPGPSDGADQGRETEPSGATGMAAMCPMKVPNTAVSVVDTEGGVELVFRTADDADVDELRRRVHAMAQRHDAHHGGAKGQPGSMHGDGHGQGGDSMHGGSMHGDGHGMGMMKVPPSTATAEDDDDGARLILRPTDPADLTALREHVRGMAAKMNEGRCPMMTSEDPGPQGEAATDDDAS